MNNNLILPTLKGAYYISGPDFLNDFNLDEIAILMNYSKISINEFIDLVNDFHLKYNK